METFWKAISWANFNILLGKKHNCTDGSTKGRAATLGADIQVAVTMAVESYDKLVNKSMPMWLQKRMHLCVFWGARLVGMTAHQLLCLVFDDMTKLPNTVRCECVGPGGLCITNNVSAEVPFV
jgi:hypothetical protein